MELVGYWWRHWFAQPPSWRIFIVIYLSIDKPSVIYSLAVCDGRDATRVSASGSDFCARSLKPGWMFWMNWITDVTASRCHPRWNASRSFPARPQTINHVGSGPVASHWIDISNPKWNEMETCWRFTTRSGAIATPPGDGSQPIDGRWDELVDGAHVSASSSLLSGRRRRRRRRRRRIGRGRLMFGWRWLLKPLRWRLQ